MWQHNFMMKQIFFDLIFLSENTGRLFRQFRQAKFANGGSILSSSQFLLLPQLPRKMEFATKVVKSALEIIILLSKI
jgi:hypothetical protein